MMQLLHGDSRRGWHERIRVAKLDSDVQAANRLLWIVENRLACAARPLRYHPKFGGREDTKRFAPYAGRIWIWRAACCEWVKARLKVELDGQFPLRHPLWRLCTTGRIGFLRDALNISSFRRVKTEKLILLAASPAGVRRGVVSHEAFNARRAVRDKIRKKSAVMWNVE